MSGDSTAQTVHPVARVQGRVDVPGDKSISHRCALLGSIAEGETLVTHYSPGADCASTIACLRALGVTIEVSTPDRSGCSSVRILGAGLGGLRPSSTPLDAGNSGTTMRLLTGILAAHPFTSEIGGDASLSRRPMGRVIKPLEAMGARISSHDGRPPLTIQGTHLKAISYASPIASAQVKSAVLLAGLHADGRTEVSEPALSRDHTERILPIFGVAVDRQGLTTAVDGGRKLAGARVHVPGDASSAAFFAVAAAALPGSDVLLTGVNLNPTRIGWVDVLRRAGAEVTLIDGPVLAGEPGGDIRVRHGDLRPFAIEPDEVPRVIDEIPALAALATFGGAMTVRGASELRVKESDRITAFVSGLRALGGRAEEHEDGFTVDGSHRLSGGTADACDDHRLAMAFAVMSLGAEQPGRIVGAEAARISYPGFFDDLAALC